MKSFTKESALLPPVAGYMRRHGFSRQQEEMQFFDYSIDLYGFSKRDGKTTAIELKLERWTRALQQALIYQLCADLVYIALPAEVIDRVEQVSLAKHGIGLIAVLPTRCTIVLDAIPSSVIIRSYRDFYIHLLQDGDNS